MWGALDPNMQESWPEDPATKAWKDAEAQANLAALERAKSRTWGETWQDVKNNVGGWFSSPQQFGSLSPVAPNDDPFALAAARQRNAVRPISGRNEGPVTKLSENLVPAVAEGIASGVTAPGDAMAGKLPMWGPEGQTSPEAVRRAFDTASLAGGGAVGGAARASIPVVAADAAKAAAPIGFYSALDRAIEGATTKRAPGAQWEATLRNAGVKPEEMDWRGVTELLQQRRAQPITKEELSAHLQANPPPEIKPVDKGVPPAWENLTPEQRTEVEQRYYQRYGDEPRYQPEGGPEEFYRQQLEADVPPSGVNAAKWEDYTLPRGYDDVTNYRERLLTMPGSREAMLDAATQARLKYGLNSPEHKAAIEAVPPEYKSSHWDEPNVIVHRRSTDREFPVAFTPEEQATVDARRAAEEHLYHLRRRQGEVGREITSTARPLEQARLSAAYNDMKAGKITPAEYQRMLEEPFDHPQLAPLQERLQALRAQEDAVRAGIPAEVQPRNVRSLHAEEIQSDWHQAGRKQGYQNDEALRAAEDFYAANKLYRDAIKRDAPEAELATLDAEAQRLRAVADQAKERSRDAVPDAPFKKTWHELGVKDLLREAVEGDYPRISWTSGGAHPTNPKNLNVGGGAPNAERLAAYEKADAGMRGFYDKILPEHLNKIGKRYGVKVERGSLPDRGGLSGEAAMNRMGIPKAEQSAFWDNLNETPGGRDAFMQQARDKGHDVFYMDIPEQMRNDIRSKGFSLFEDTGPQAQAIATAGALNERAGAQAGLDVRGGLGGAAGGEQGVAAAQAAAARHAGAIRPLEGLPVKPLSVGGQPYVPGPIGSVHDVAKSYMESTGRPYARQDRYHPVNEERARNIAKAFDEMEHAPNDPKVRASYNAMIRETRDQYDAAVKSGVKFEPIPAGMPDPYAETPRLAAKDVQENNHLWYFPTENGYGADVGNPNAVKAISDNPMLQPSGRKDVNGNEMLNNDLFRVVHDYFGHLKEGYGFRAAGEDNAWRTHAQMYSDEAKPAMTSETRGQNSWVNYGPYGESNRTASAADTRYADQKVGLLPDWVWKDELGPPAAPAIAKGRSQFVDDSGMARPGAGYTKEAQRINKEIAAGPKGEGPLDLSRQPQVPDVEQRPLERYVPARGISPRMQDALQNKKVRKGIQQSMEEGRGVEQWYHTEPVRQVFIEQLGPDEGPVAFKRYMDQVAATSPRSDVPTNIRNASYYYAGGDPKKANPYPYGHVAQNLHKQNISNIAEFGGWDVMQNPKPASFAENLRGNLEPVTVDTHAFRNIGMRTGDPRFLETSFTQKRNPGAAEDTMQSRFGETKTDKKGQTIVTFRPQSLVESGKLSMKEAQKIPAFWAAKPHPSEYAAAEQLFREIGNKAGMRPADAQAAAWAGAGEMTGLGTVGTHTFNELMNERIMFTAKMRGESPQKVLRDFVRGKKPLLSDTSHGAAFGSLDGSEDR